MSKVLVTCPACDGKKTVPITMNGMRHSMECHICDGVGEVTPEKKAEFDTFRAIWCRCDKPESPRFFDDGEHPEFDKHHWRCTACEKITQIG